ncbi:PAS domain S-box protein [Polaromonas aquatica]|uniref:PAS domain S-box protein n=1 Tax=Polaromonas aquatica TaxID=332657 RepID=UPI003D660F58
MKRDETPAQAQQRMQDEALALAAANDALKLEIAEQRHMVEALRDDISGLRSLVTISSDWYWEQDAQYRFTDFAAEFSNRSRDKDLDSSVGKCRWELPGALPVTMSWEDHRAVLAERQPFRDFEYIRVLDDGVAHYFSISGVPVFDKHREFVGYRGITRDVTASRRAEEKERKVARLLDDIVENLPVALHMKSAKDHRFMAWNRAAEELYGVTRAEALGRTVHDLWPKAHAHNMYAADLSLIASGEMQEFPDRLTYTKHRGAIHVHMRKVPLKDSSGAVTHVLVIAEDITQQLADEARLRSSERQFRSLASLSSDWYWETDEKFRFTKLSGGKTEEARRVISEHIGKTRWEIDHSPANEELWANHRAQLERHEVFRNFEYEREEKDGSRVTLSISGEPMVDANGRFTGYHGVGTDITARLEAEAKLRRSEERFRSLTGLSSDWYWEQDKNFRNVFVSNDPQRFALGTQVIGEGQCRWDLPNSAPLVGTWKEHKAVLQAHLPFRNFEYRLTNEDGRVIYRSVSGEPMFDDDGVFEGYRGVGADITSRKEVEMALRVGEARFRAVVGALVEGVVLRDAEGHIVDCNASAERILGRTLAQLKGQTSVEPEWLRFREDGTPMPREEWPSVAAVRTGQPQLNRVVCHRRSDGSEFWALINVQPLVEGNGAPSGYVSTITDISKRRQAEQEIVQLNVNLEKRVLRRTAQLEAATREIEAFSYSVAHDLRTPLSTIDGFCALLEKAVPRESGERAHHFLGRIRSSVHRMGELTDGLLSLAQLSRTSLNWESVDISAEAAKIIKQWIENDPERLVRITVEPNLWGRADVALLRQVLENLIANAWKFTSKKPHTEILVGKEAGPDGQTVYFVRDNGAGFDMAYANKLFGTFERLHSPDEFAGSGIGLATVKRIITRHGGKIWANSAVGEGSTFYFTLGGEQAGAMPPGESSFEDSGIALSGSAAAVNDSEGASLRVNESISTDNDVFTVSDKQFSNAFEHAAIGMTLIGIDSRRLKVNTAFCQMLGYSEAEMLSRTIHDLTHPDDIAWDLEQRRRALAGEIESFHVEKRYIHKSGRIVWGYMSCSLVRDADRKPLQFIAQIQDITERKETEQVLRESEERFRALTALSSDWFWEQDENFRFVEVPGEVPSATGITKSAHGKTPWELDYINIEAAALAKYKATIARHEVFRDLESTRLDSKGRLHYFSISGVPKFDANGKFTGYRGTGRDTTEMRRVTEALRTSEAQLREITDTVPAWITYADANQQLRFHNRAYEEVFGLTNEQLEGKTIREILGDEMYAVVKPRVDEVLQGYPVVYERAQKTARGGMRDYVVNYFPRYGDGPDEGKVIGFYTLANDVTELKRIDRMKSEFVSTVSHELRTPLTSIRGSLGLISGGVAGQLPDTVKTLVGIAKTNCERLIRLINDILDIEKIESGKMTLDFQVVELEPLLAQALAANEGYGAAKNVHLRLDFPDEELQVRVDSDRLTQVVTNLLSNAMKFSPEGGTVDIQVSRSDAGIRVEVRDHGPGIPEEFRNRIFQKFSQADSSDTRQKGGTGLGLNISRAIIERLGGSIGFHTEAGAGTTFFFELPEWVDSPVRTSGFSALVEQRQRVLICEDDKDISRLISMMLDKGGFDTETVFTAKQAMAELARKRYAAVTIDLKLPDQDGIALIRALRAQLHTRDVPIVVVSASAAEGRVQFNDQSLTVSDWLEKPIDENMLVLGVRRAIAGSTEARAVILHVEDDPDIQRIAATIAQGFATFVFADTVQEARDRLQEQRFDLVLLDLSLPGGSGWDLLKDIEGMNGPPPVVIFSALEVDRAQATRAAAVLVKAKTSNTELLETLRRVLGQGLPAASPQDGA